ncbi:hypothetical protein JTB14_002880 [Gonioctena quinquepunctata]|nr:hypothetical protein JTB14_002880 [Gonioctena quinquepunctata]
MTFSSAIDGKVDKNSGKKEISYLKIILQQKDMIINQQDTIESLKAQLKLTNVILNNNKNEYSLPPADGLNNMNSIPIEVQIPTTISSNVMKKSSKRLPISQTSVSSAVATPVSSTALQVSAKKQITTAQVSYAVKCATVTSRDSKVATIEEPGSSNLSIRHVPGISSANSDIGNAENFTRVPYRKKQPIVGALEVKNNIDIKVLPKLAYLHVYKINPRMTVEELKSILIDSFPEVVVEKIYSMYPDHYSSFKVSVDFANLTKAMHPNIWPEGAYVNRFFHRRKDAKHYI